MEGPIPPIVLDDAGDIVIFKKTSDAEMYIEAIDLRSGRCSFLDSRGRTLDWQIKKKWTGVEKISLFVTEDSQEQPERLRSKLIEFLSALPVEEGANFTSYALEELLVRAKKYEKDY